MSKPATKMVVTAAEWNPSAIRYMQPKVNDRGGKSINIISSQTGRGVAVSTPGMMTWGVGDFVDEKTGESDGKFSMSLVFPNEDYATAATTEFLEKFKTLENQILDDAVKHSEAWFGEEMSREVAKHTFFSALKYSKDKTTKKIDPSKPPSIRAKVPNYGGKWGIQIYDTNPVPNLMFPCDDVTKTPMDFIQKRSTVACLLQCGGLWFGGKGWGVTWKVIQCAVKPQEMESIYSRCHIQLSPDDITALSKQEVKVDDADEDVDVVPATNTEVADSDAEDGDDADPEPEPKAVVKKVIKKAPVEVAPVVADDVATATEPVKKKIIKKKPTV
jgi:hypothetical protein